VDTGLKGEYAAVRAETSTTSSAARTARVALAALWTLTIMALCWLPRAWVHEVEGGSSWFQIPHFDKVVHASIFALFSVLWLRAVSGRRRYLLIFLAGFLLAAMTELVQNLPIVGRDADAVDALTDVAGVAFGLAVAPLVEPLARFVERRLFREPSA
jgi:hypothetical protein